jgi:hypothetical protein
MSSTSDLPTISKGDKRKPSTTGAGAAGKGARKQSSAGARGPAPPKTGAGPLPKKSPRKASTMKNSGSEDERSVVSGIHVYMYTCCAVSLFLLCIYNDI